MSRPAVFTGPAASPPRAAPPTLPGVVPCRDAVPEFSRALQLQVREGTVESMRAQRKRRRRRLRPAAPRPVGGGQRDRSVAEESFAPTGRRTGPRRVRGFADSGVRENAYEKAWAGDAP